MAISKRNRLIAAAAFFMLPLAANAATITHSLNLVAGQLVSEAEVIFPSQEVEFRYFALEDFDITSFSLSATGNSAGGDVHDILFGFTSPGTIPFSDIQVLGTTAFGGGFLPGFQVLAGDVFSVFFGDGILNPVAITLSFQTDAPAAIPLPASGMFLGSALLAFGTYASRKRKIQGRNFTA